MVYIGNNGEYFEVADINKGNCAVLKVPKGNTLLLLWFETDGNRLKVDSIEQAFNTNDLICLTEFHKVEILEVKALKMLRFNRSFYCILDHDSQVGCKGILYYGAAQLPIIQVVPHLEVLETVWKMLVLEMKSRDNLQLEMLQMMLKRILILCTRLYKEQATRELGNVEVDIVREFNFLVEQHFREKHDVATYAKLLSKAPKTLSNLFKKMGEKTPLQFIQARLMLEARRLLRYTDKPVSEIGYELGFLDVQSFSRFFKRQEGVSPLNFRDSNELITERE